MDLYMSCQICSSSFTRVCAFKAHLHSTAHQQGMKNIFQRGVRSYVKLPNIVVLNPGAVCDIRVPIIGLSVCFSGDQHGPFYLCHFCEEKHPSPRIISHLSSIDHCSNYYNHTNPNALTFSWLPSVNIKDMLRLEVTQKLKDRGRVQLQVLELPVELIKRLQNCTYSEVMHIFSENEKLFKQLEVANPERMMIQSYLKDQKREHPLLGMQHLVECICVGQTEKRFYLCTLCHLMLASRAIIKHILSFDHIYCYFKAWHPSTLLARESYREYDKPFASRMLDLVKQAEEIYGTAHCDMKQMSLEPEEFKKINLSCYEKALEELESLRKENDESSLITSIKPGRKLECRTVSYKLRCQNCRESLPTISVYCRHVFTRQHKLMLRKSFGDNDGCNLAEWKPSLGIYTYLNESLKINKPIIGVPLVVTCVSTGVQQKPLYVCFACQESFPESSLRQHFNSQKHLIQTLLYQNPWRLTFAWEDHLDVNVLRSMAWEEERERGPNQMLLKVLYIPNALFQSLNTCDYLKVMEKLELHHTLLRHDVPKCETHSKLQHNERFPLLGRQFLVMHSVCVRGYPSSGVGFLCLLCERRLSDDESYAHVFSREHVATFLDCFHPGSLNSSTDAKSILDLAKQAARIHPVSHVQVIKLVKPIWEPCSYSTALSILQSANKREKKATLKPTIVPRMKLIPREPMKEMDKDNVRDNSQENSGMMEGCEETTSKKSTGNSETTLQETSVEGGAEASTTQYVERGENAEKVDDKEKQSELRKEVLPEMSSQEIKNAGSETCQVIKEVKIEEPTAGGVESPENCQNTHNNDAGKERQCGKDILTNFTQKREISQEDSDPVEGVQQEMSPKRQLIASCEEPKNLPSMEQKEGNTADERERDKTSQETATCKASSKVTHQQADQLWQYVKTKSREPVIGVNALVECHCDEQDPIYLCECCSLKISEKDIISHVTGVPHQWLYLRSLQALPPRVKQGQPIREFAVLFEQQNGYGEAQVVELDDENFQKILKQNFISAKQTVKTLEDQQASEHELPPTSAHQEVEMEIDDDSKGSESKISSVSTAMSVITETTVNTAKVPPKSKDMELMETDNAGTCLTASRSTEDKAEIISKTVVGPLKTTCKTGGTFKIAAASDSAVTTSTTSMTDNSSSPTLDSNKPSAPFSKLIAAASTCTASTCTAAATKLKETARENTANISICSAPTSSATIPSTTFTTESATSLKLPESRTGTTATVSVTSHKAATTSNAETTVAVCRAAPASRVENASINSANAPRTMVTPEVTAKMTETPVKCRNTEAPFETAHMKSSVMSTAVVAPNIHKSKPPAAPHQTTSKTTEPSNSGSKKKQSESPVGLDQLIKVKCDEKKQVYCQLCSVRLPGSSHVTSYTHQFNYVKIKFPELKQSELQSKLPMLVAELSKDKASENIRTLKVNIDEYKELADLSEDKAIERLKAMERRRGRRISSSPMTDTAESPCEASSPVDAGKMKNPQGCAHPVAANTAGSFDQTSDRCKETLVKRQLQERSHPGAKDEQEMVDGSRKASPVKFLNPAGLSSAAAVTEQQSQPGPDQREGRVLKPSQELPLISIGESIKCRSNLFRYLEVKGLNSEPILGLGLVWECRGVSESSFYLCESCSKTFPRQDICQHMVSLNHLNNFIRMQHPGFLYFMKDKSLKQWMRNFILKGIAELLSKREHPMETDAQCILLSPEMYETVRTASFSEALKIVQDIKKKKKVNISCPLICVPQQDNKNQQSPEESLPMEVQPARALETDQRSDSGPIQNTEDQPGGDNLRRDLSVSSKAVSVVPAPENAVTTLSHQDQPEPRSPVSQHQWPIPVLKQAEACSESPSSGPKTSETLPVSPTAKCLPTRKRPAVESVDALVRSCTKNQLEDPLPAKSCKLQPVCESASRSPSVNPAANFIPLSSLSPTDKDTEPGSDEQDIPVLVDQSKCDVLIAMLREIRSGRNMPPTLSAPNNGQTTNSGSEDSSERVEERKSDPQPVPTSSKMAPKQTKWDSKCRQNPPLAISAEEVLATAAPEVLSCENQLAIPDANLNTVVNDNAGQLPINSIISARPSRPKQWFMSSGQEHSEVHGGDQVAHTSPTVATVNPGHASGLYNHLTYSTNGQASCFSSEAEHYATPGYATPVSPPVYAGNAYQGFSTGGLYPYQVFPQQEAIRFSLQSFEQCLVAPPIPEWVRLGMFQQQLLQQQQPWTSASPAAGGVNVINTVPFMTPPNNS